MYLYKTEAKQSTIEGKGVFTLEHISKDFVVWKYEPIHDLSLSEKEFELLSEEKKKELEKVGYLSPASGTWIYPPENDPARYTNHSAENNNLSVVFDQTISPEPFFKANRDIVIGEELIVNYLEFDDYIKQTKPEWI